MVGFDRTTLIFETVSGSRAYGTDGPESDEDIRGVYVEPARSLITLRERPEQLSDSKGDTVYYALRRFLELASGANPNIIELLYMPGNCVRLVDPVFQPILDARQSFITRQAYVSHVRYAQAQVRKARGQNKWINNPQSEKIARASGILLVPAGRQCWQHAIPPGSAGRGRRRSG